MGTIKRIALGGNIEYKKNIDDLWFIGKRQQIIVGFNAL